MRFCNCLHDGRHVDLKLWILLLVEEISKARASGEKEREPELPRTKNMGTSRDCTAQDAQQLSKGHSPLPFCKTGLFQGFLCKII